MKIVHVNTSPYGGAAKAAIGQHLALLEAGINSEMLFLFGNIDNIPHARLINFKFPFYKRILRRLNLFQTQEMKNEVLKKKIKEEFEFISFPWSDYRLDLNKYINEADIVNLHWVSNFLDYSSFFKNYKKPIAWTLHDMNPFLGIYHFSDDETNDSQIRILNNDVLKSKTESIKTAKKVMFICPSSWMLKELKSSNLKEYDSCLIPYSVNLNVFTIHTKVTVREELGIPADKKVLLFVSDRISNKRKGFDILKEALDYVKTSNVLLIAIGGNIDGLGTFKHEILMPGRIDNENLLAKFYAAADAFILPSRQDNLPNVMLESLACGTPVISFNIGGMQDFIIDKKNGIIATEVSSEALSVALNEFLIQGVSWKQDEIRSFAVQNFSPKKQTDLLVHAYQKLL